MFASLKQLEQGVTFLSEMWYEAAESRYASCKLLDVRYIGRPFQTSDGQDFFWFCLNASSADNVA